MEAAFISMADKWPSAIVSRSELKSFTGGVISAQTAANLDSLGKGIAGRFRIGRKVCYSVENVIAFLKAQSLKIED